jgi:bifunctional DNA-binding transcriptional regulator/antitoxin component of YhaV-PrlF toxin-antitoxin module
MQITKLSSKGQIVIPESIRSNMKIGTSFIVSKQGSLIILKEVEGLTSEEIEEAKELDKIWQTIDEGKAVTLSTEDFAKEMENW